MAYLLPNHTQASSIKAPRQLVEPLRKPPKSIDMSENPLHILVCPNTIKAIAKHRHIVGDQIADLRVPFYLPKTTARVIDTLHQPAPGLTPAFSMKPLKVVCLFRSG